MEVETRELSNDELRALIAEKNRTLREGTRKQQRLLIANDVIMLLEAEALRAKHNGFLRLGYSHGGALTVEAQDALGVDEVGHPRQAGQAPRLDPQKLKEAFERIEILQQCDVCALGACTVAAVRQFNRFSPVVVSGAFQHLGTGDGSLITYLKEFFEEKQLAMIEAAYETGDGWYNKDHSLVRTEENRQEPIRWTTTMEVECQSNECVEPWHEVEVEHESEQPVTRTAEWWQEAVKFGERYPHTGNERLLAIMQNIVDNDGEFIP